MTHSLVRIRGHSSRRPALAASRALGSGLADSALGLALGVAEAAGQSTQRLPPPGGTYAVGVVEYRLTDRSRPDSLVPTMESGRTMKVVLWYPAVGGTRGPATYLTALEARRSVLGDDFVANAASVRGTAR